MKHVSRGPTNQHRGRCPCVCMFWSSPGNRVAGISGLAWQRPAVILKETPDRKEVILKQLTLNQTMFIKRCHTQMGDGIRKRLNPDPLTVTGSGGVMLWGECCRHGLCQFCGVTANHRKAVWLCTFILCLIKYLHSVEWSLSVWLTCHPLSSINKTK